MTGPSDKAIEAARRFGGPPGVVTVRAAYPIIRADVIAEVVAKLRTGHGPKTYLGQSNYALHQEIANFIEREFGE